MKQKGDDMDDTCFFWMIPSSYGEIGLVWTGFGKKQQIERILLPRPHQTVKERMESLHSQAVPYEGDDLPFLVRKIASYLEGRNVTFLLSDLGERGMEREGSFRRSILLQTMTIPRGMVDSYGGLAAKAGHYGAARAVGTTMATNPFPLVVPCHRIVRSDGSIGQFGGGAPMKKWLLNMEGVAFDSEEKVSAGNFL
jgi:methylated-DNA-[protein]-cysteine S-methyltransferase